MQHEGDDDTNRNWCTWKICKGLVKGLGNKRINRGHPVHSIIRYCEESWRLEETCCHSNPSEKPSAGEKKTLRGVKHYKISDGPTKVLSKLVSDSFNSSIHLLLLLKRNSFLNEFLCPSFFNKELYSFYLY